MLLLLLADRAPAAVLYVDVNSTNATPPYTNWATAAQTIQNAVDAAAAGDEIVVTNGVYATGGRTFGTNVLVNRVAVDRPVTVRSVSGPAVTVIQGYQVPSTTNGDGAIRCVYLTNGAVLSGFTLTNGATGVVIEGDNWDSWGGGVLCGPEGAMVTNCSLIGNSAMLGGGAFFANLYNCSLAGNRAYDCGAAAHGALNNCTVTGNSAARNIGGVGAATLNNCTVVSNVAASGSAGGVGAGTLSNCTVIGNSAFQAGGGIYYAAVYNCTVSGNSAYVGAGTALCTNYHCNLVGNSASQVGGGADSSTLNNCIVTRNSALYGGGVSRSTLFNCAVTSNSAGSLGGGTYAAMLTNCIVFYNNLGASNSNYAFGGLSHCCTTPFPPSGAGNITNEPLFADPANGDFRLQPNSPCINSGNNADVFSTTDLSGNPRIVGGTVDIGAYEFQTPATRISIAWLQQFALPTDGSADFADLDNDRLNNWQEWRCGTDPTNALSVLRLLTPGVSRTDLAVSWESVSNRSYVLEWSTNLATPPAFQPLATNLVGQSGTTTFTHTNGASATPRFYRVGVE